MYYLKKKHEEQWLKKMILEMEIFHDNWTDFTDDNCEMWLKVEKKPVCGAWMKVIMFNLWFNFWKKNPLKCHNCTLMAWDNQQCPYIVSLFSFSNSIWKWVSLRSWVKFRNADGYVRRSLEIQKKIFQQCNIEEIIAVYFEI